MDSSVLVSRVVAEHPFINVDSFTDADGEEAVTFTPPNDTGASVTVSFRADGTVTVAAGSFFENLDEWPLGEHRLGAAIDLVLSFAEHGYLRLRSVWGYLTVGLDIPRGMDNRYIAGPAAGFWGVDEYVGRFGYSVTEWLDPWQGTRAANSD